MRSRIGRMSAFALALLLATPLIPTTFSAAVAAANVNPAQSAELDAIISLYVDAASRQKEAMKGAEMEAEIAGRLPGLKESGTMKVLRKISRVGEISIQTIRTFAGDDRIRKDVIARYLEEEQEASGYGALSITPAHYIFEIKAILKEKDRSTYVFDVTPKHKMDGAVEGEVWVDGATGMPLREAVELVRSPSFWLTKIRMIRDYELRNGMSVITRMRNRAAIRIIGVGGVEIDIDYSNFNWPEQGDSTSARLNPTAETATTATIRQ